jgi:hypothetical protein
LQPIDLFRDSSQSRDVFCFITPALLVANHCEAFSQRLRQVDQSSFHCVLLLFSPVLPPSLGEQLPFGFKPIGFRVARQSKSAPAFGNEISPEANGVV